MVLVMETVMMMMVAVSVKTVTVVRTAVVRLRVS